MTQRKRALTGVKPTGTPHLGNIIGAIHPAIALSEKYDTFYFIADAHALTTVTDPNVLRHQTFEVAATWIACGLDPDTSIFYRQSDIIDVYELSWIFHCLSPKGLMNRAHAYKAIVDAAIQAGDSDADSTVNMGLFSYPILMAADIIMYSADFVPVGQDQKQHVEIARDIALKFNNTYGELLTVPEPLIAKDVATLPGLDWRKMSKSYNNIISIFVSDDDLLKQIKKFKTDSVQPGETRDPDEVPIFKLLEVIGSNEAIKEVRSNLENGNIRWGDIKELLFEEIKREFGPAREKYAELVANPGYVDEVLAAGAVKAREHSAELMSKVRKAVGLR